MRWPTAVLLLALLISPAVAPSQGAALPQVDQRLAHADELFEQGHSAEARKICEEVMKSLPGGPSTQLAYALNVMSKIYASEGDYEQAIASAQRSASVYEQVGDKEGEAHALNNQGIAEIQAGKYEPAQQDLQRALALGRAANDLENQTQILNNLGSTYFFRGSYSEAARSNDQAMALVTANPSAKWSDYWLQITSFNQATLLQRLGRYDRALKIYRDVQARAKTLTDNDRAHLATNLGALYRRLGDPYKALDSYKAAVRFYSMKHDLDGAIGVTKNIGIVYALDLEDFVHASSMFHAALSLANVTKNRREQMQSHLYLGETLLRDKKLAPAREEFERAQSLAVELATPEEQWKSLYGLGRIASESGDSQTAEHNYREAISLIEQSRGQLQLAALRTDFFADKREVYDALLAMLFKRNDAREAFMFLEKSRARNFQDRLRQNQLRAQQTAQSNTAPSLEQIQGKLPQQTALLEFWTAGNQLGLLWCTQDQSGAALKELPAEMLDRTLTALRNLPDGLEHGSSAEHWPLNNVLVDPWPLPSGIKHLLIVPDGWISSVPFDLLRDSTHPHLYLVDRYDITYLPTAELIQRPRPLPRLRWPWTHELAAFGDPLIEPNSSDEDLLAPVAQRLPYSSKEIEEVAHLARGRSELFLRQDNRKATFLAGAANRALLLHLSTHAFADTDNPENSRLLFSAEGSGTAYVYLRELYDLNLGHVELATISACDTERGKVLRGEGAQAFSRALLSAGAGSSLTTLWRVDDAVTAEFMAQFYYFLLQENKPKAEALRLAKMKFAYSRTKLVQPSAWAAFVINGDGLTPVSRVISWSELLAATASVVLLAIVAIAFLRSRRGGHGQDHA